MQKDKKLPICIRSGVDKSEKFLYIFSDHDLQTPKPPSVKKVIYIYIYIYRVFLKGLYKIVGGIVDMKINIIKQETMVRKRLL